MLLSFTIIISLILIGLSPTISSKDSLPSFDLVQKYIGGLSKKLPMLAESPSALIEQDFYSSMKAHQDVSQTTRLLENELVSLQQTIGYIDKLTAEQRRDITLHIQRRKLQLASVISRTAKILRVAYTLAYPTKKDEPIIIIPKTSSDIEIEKAFMMLKEGEKELRDHNLTQCAALADAFLWAQRERENTKNEFQEQMDRLQELPLKDRAAFDKEKIQYWNHKAEEAKKFLQS